MTVLIALIYVAVLFLSAIKRQWFVTACIAAMLVIMYFSQPFSDSDYTLLAGVLVAIAQNLLTSKRSTHETETHHKVSTPHRHLR
ncbi:hypothetical protein [Shewanella halifaxensis]|uniref:hypothetical protein n=1 Tax=Shewanella halifaxensis TaxID=271098 RepID=UPI0013A62F18|nr:hypothetical protein [Shewanella halifaxensis]